MMMKPLFTALILYVAACTPVTGDQVPSQSSDRTTLSMNNASASDMAYEEPNYPQTPDVRAIMHNLIRLIGSLHTRADFNAQHVNQIAQISLEQKPTTSDEEYEYNSYVNPNWGTLYVLFPNQDNAGFSRILFTFWSRHPEEELPVTDICVVDLEAFHKAMHEQGYQYTGDSRTGLAERVYRRGIVEVIAGYRGEFNEEFERYCIQYLDIGTLGGTIR